MGAISSRALGARLVDWRAGHPVAYRALADRLRALILDGRIPLDARLPAERALAEHLALSRTTVSAAYAELRELGYLESLRGSGSVARLPLADIPGTPEPAEGTIDFTRATMPTWRGVASAAARAARQLPAHLVDSGYDPVGLPLLRERIAQHYRGRGLPTDADEIVVTIGAQHAIALVGRTLISRGDRVAVENPSYPHALEALRAAGGRLAPIGVGVDDGWDADALEQTLTGAAPTLAYLMPDSHNPTGRSMPEDQRARTAALARRAGCVVVVDETMRGLHLEGADHPPFAVHDASAITIGSLGKSVWGGLRIGWIRARRPIAARLVRARSTHDLGTPVLEQLTAAELLPELDAILGERRAGLREGRDHVVAELRHRIPEWSVPSPEGGLTTWVGLGRPLSSQLALRARSEGLLIASGARFGVDGAFERFLRVPHSLRRAELDAGLDILARAWSAVLDRPERGVADDFAQIA